MNHSAFIVALLALAASPSAFAQFEPSFQLQFDLAFVDPSGGGVSVDVGGTGVGVDLDPGAGAGFRGEYLFSETLGVELGLLGTSNLDIRVGDLGGSVGTAVSINSFSPVTLGLNYHFPTGGKVDIYAGPLIAIVNYGNIESSVSIGGVSSGTDVDNDFGWGAIAGIDIPIGSRGWSVHSSLRYIQTSMKGTSDGVAFDTDFDPLILSVGVAYRF